MFTDNFLRNIIYQMYTSQWRCFFIFWRKLQGSCLHSENIKFRPENAQWLFSIKWQKLWGLIELARIYLTVVMMYTNEANFPREYVTENINPERTENHQSPFTTITYILKKIIHTVIYIYNTRTITPLIHACIILSRDRDE